MFRTKKKTNTISQWIKVGIHASESHKNDLIFEILSELSENNISLDCADGWINAEWENLVGKVINLVFAIKALAEDISVYVVFENNSLKELVITSKNYKKSILDEITDKIMEYEDKIGREINFYYVEKIGCLPENAVKI